jgi:hypothetical protein
MEYGALMRWDVAVKNVVVQELRPYSSIAEISRDLGCYCVSTGNSYDVSKDHSSKRRKLYQQTWISNESEGT